VTYLKTLLAGSAPAQPAINGTYDFSGGGNATTNPGPFAPFGLGTLQNKLDFFKLAQLFEDFGVRAYKGQLSNLIGSSSLAPAMRIHTEEARHAAMIRILRASGSGQAAAATTSLPNPIAPWPAYNATTTSLYDSAAPGATNYAFTTGTAAASGKNQSDIATLVYGPAVPLVNSVQGTTAAPGSTGEDNVSYVSSFVRFQTTSTGTAEAFDEPMSTAAVTAFAALFGVA
jgi:hypothetical protein